jgi:hypothetical protein
MRNAAILALVLAGCGDDAQHHTSVIVDGHGSDSGSPDAPEQNGPNLVQLEFFGTPDLIEYRDGNGPWVVPTMVSGVYQLHVTDDYQVVAACSFSSLAGNEDSEQLNATFGDGATQFMFCSGSSSPGTTFAVTGQMLQPGNVQMQDTAMGATSPWSFSLNVSAGTHELVAIGATKMLIRRNLALSAATAVPDVDVTTAGTAFTSATATVIGADPTDSVHIQSGLFTGNDFATLSDTTDKTIIYAPNSLIAANDGPQLQLQVTNMANTVARSVFTYGPTSATMFTLPTVLTGVTFGSTEPITASWGTLPDYSTAEVLAFGGTQSSFLEQYVSATKAWLDKTGATSLAFQSDAANYNPAWNVPTAGAFIEFAVANNTDSQGGSTNTGVISGGAPAVARMQSPLRDHRHARR